MKNIFYSLLLILLSTSAFCQDDQSGAPKIPDRFDRATVEQMLNRVEQGTNFPVLKAGYFLGRRTQPFPVAQGLVLLEQKLQKERRGSKRWLLLQWLRAYGTLRLKEDSRDKALLIYSGLFDEMNKQPKAVDLQVARRIIHDFVFHVPSKLVTDMGQSSTEVEPVLFKALGAYLRLGSPSERRPPWVDAIWRVKSDDEEWFSFVDKAQKNSFYPKNASFYLTLAQVLRSANTRRDEEKARQSFALLSKARGLAQSDKELLFQIQEEESRLTQENDWNAKGQKLSAKE